MHRGIFRVIILSLFLVYSAPAAATQTHGDPEGLLVHQVTHIFFALSMGLLIYWLRVRGLTRASSGWRQIQYAALLFIFWTMDAFLVHMLDELSGWIAVSQIAPWTLSIQSSFHSALPVLYYLVKLDHLLCVPAMLMLYLGIKRLNQEGRAEEVRE